MFFALTCKNTHTHTHTHKYFFCSLFLHLFSSHLRKQTVRVDVSIEVYYTLPNLLDKSAPADLCREKPSWFPAFQFCNLVEDAKVIEETFNVNKHTGEVLAFLNWVIVFQDRVELKRFPFDCQLLTLDATFDGRVVAWPSTHNNNNNNSSKNNQNNIAITTTDNNNNDNSSPAKLQHFDTLRDKLGGELQTILDAESHMWRIREARLNVKNGLQGAFESSFSVQVFVDRKASYYMWNICFLFYLLVLCSCVVVALDLKDGLGDRQSFNITLILTGVAFKYVINGLIPKSSTLTYLDKYLLIGFVLLCSVLFKDFVLAQWVVPVSEHSAALADDIFTIALAAGWTLVNILFAAAAKFKWLALSTRDIELNERRKVNSNVSAMVFQ